MASIHSLKWLAALLLVGCAGAADPGPSADSEDLTTGKLVVNGHTPNAREQKWLRYVATDVVPHLGGTREERLVTASQTAWWALKEGDFDISLPPAYSNCNASTGDHLIGPLSTCEPHRAWQVGLSGVQVPGHSVADLERLAGELFPGQSIASVLEDAAAEGGFSKESETSKAIASSTGSLRASWLLRRSPIGFTVAARSEIVPECITGDKGWCHGTRWDTTALFAPTREAIHRSISDIHGILAGLAP